MTAYYNEIDPYAAQWLRNLIAAGHIPHGEVDERSIVAVRADDLDPYDECHFFAGIGGWPLALRLAGWRGPVWTGSCPCQPLSSAGQRRGHADSRHLWPAFHALIAERRPATVFGEQVAGKDGSEWLAGVRADLEAAGYAVGAADLCAASHGAPHIRQRLFWVADAEGWPTQRERQSDERLRPWQLSFGRYGADGGAWDSAVWLACLDGKSRRTLAAVQPLVDARGCICGLRLGEDCACDQKPSRVGMLRGAGNAISPPVAAEFIRAFMEAA